MHDGKPNTAMGAWRDALCDDESWDALAYWERWLPKKLAGVAAGSGEMEPLLDHDGTVDCDDRGCRVVFRARVGDTGHRWADAHRVAPTERDLILGEVRMLLKAVHGVVTGLAGQDQEANRAQIAQAARSAGMDMAADVNPALMAKLPLPFKQMGMSIHQDMDALADAIVQKETPQQILQRLSSMTARCTTCHDLYRFSAER